MDNLKVFITLSLRLYFCWNMLSLLQEGLAYISFMEIYQSHYLSVHTSNHSVGHKFGSLHIICSPWK